MISPATNQIVLPPTPDSALSPMERKVKQTFQEFVGKTFYSQMLSAMRKTQDPPEYMNGGRAEEIFQGQLDQELSGYLSEASADRLAGPMFEVFLAGMRNPV